MARGEIGNRKCLLTREVGERSGLLRFVADPHGRVLADIDERLPGRGMWLSANRDVVKRAVARNAFAKSARAPLTVDPDLADQVERLLARRVLDSIGLARRAGQVAMGFDQVRASLQRAAAAVLVAAVDGAADGRDKLRKLAPELPLVSVLTGDELGQAVGRERLVHMALAPGGLAQRVLRDAERLVGFRPAAVVEHGAGERARLMEPRGTTGSR